MRNITDFIKKEPAQGWMKVGRNLVAHYYMQHEGLNLFSTLCYVQSTDYNPEIHGYIHANTGCCNKCLIRLSKMQLKPVSQVLNEFIDIKGVRPSAKKHPAHLRLSRG